MCRGIVALSAKRHGARILASTSAFRRYVQLPFSTRLLGGRHGRIVLHTFECLSKCFVRYIVRNIFKHANCFFDVSLYVQSCRGSNDLVLYDRSIRKVLYSPVYK